MGTFQPTAIVQLQNILSVKNIKILIDKFIVSKVNIEDSPIDIDKEKGIISIYDSIVNDVVEIKFETYLEDLLLDNVNSIKFEIEQSNILLNNREKLKYWQSVLDSFDYMEQTNPKTFEYFPVSYKPKEEITKYLEYMYQYKPLQQIEGSSYFNLKSKFNKNDLKKIYNFLINEMYLDDEQYLFMDFYSVLFFEETSLKLIFKCPTYVMVCILDNLSKLFTDFTRKRIELSDRFYTKKGPNKESKPLSVNIYQSSINRNKNKTNTHLIKVNQFFVEHFSF